MAKQGLEIDTLGIPGDILSQIGAALPGLTIVMDHFAGLSQFQPMADSSLYTRTSEFLWRTFGEDRLIFGANWPVSDAGRIFVDSIDLEIGLRESFLAEQYVGGRDKRPRQSDVRKRVEGVQSSQVTMDGGSLTDRKKYPPCRVFVLFVSCSSR